MAENYNYPYQPLQPLYGAGSPTMASFPQMAGTSANQTPSFVYTGVNMPLSQLPAGQPDPLSDLLFVGTYGYVAALDVSGGAERPPTEVWRTNLEGTGYNPVCLIYEMPEALFCGTSAYVYKLNCRTGKVLWRFSIEGQNATLWLHGSKLLVGHGGYVSCVNAQTGATIWKGNLKGTGYLSVTMIIIGNLVYAGSNGSIFAFDLENGAPVWQYNLPGRGYGAISFLFGSSAQGRPTLYVGVNSAVVAIDLNTRQEVASVDLGGLKRTCVALSMYRGDIWVSATSELSRLDSHTLSLKQKNPLSGSGYAIGGSLLLLSVGGREVLLEGHNGYVIGVDLSSGAQLWKTTVSSMGRISTLLEHKGVVYVGCCGKLHSIDPVSGRIQWTDELKGLGYCNMFLSTIFKTTNCHSDQPIVAEHELATRSRGTYGVTYST